jgi:hypothetical protein
LFESNIINIHKNDEIPMNEAPEEVWKDCNCMNCRLARIEDNIRELKTMLDRLPMEFGEEPEKPQT